MKTKVKKLIPGFARDWLYRSIDRFLHSRGYTVFPANCSYAEAGLFTYHNSSFTGDPAFRAAYARGVQAGGGVDPHFAWRVHVALWAAVTAMRAEGDFVECGVNAGFESSAIMHRLDWARVPRRYFLVDTWTGPVMEQFSAAEVLQGRDAAVQKLAASGAYVTDVEQVRANFSEWPNAVMVQGAVPEVLPRVPAQRVAFLHIDMNCAAPEAAALEYFWPKLSKGGIVLFDDYANYEYRHQKDGLDQAAARVGASVLALPTGQGLIVS